MRALAVKYHQFPMKFSSKMGGFFLSDEYGNDDNDDHGDGDDDGDNNSDDGGDANDYENDAKLHHH